MFVFWINCDHNEKAPKVPHMTIAHTWSVLADIPGLNYLSVLGCTAS
jgi:hypothetical protein